MEKKKVSGRRTCRALNPTFKVRLVLRALREARLLRKCVSTSLCRERRARDCQYGPESPVPDTPFTKAVLGRSSKLTMDRRGVFGAMPITSVCT